MEGHNRRRRRRVDRGYLYRFLSMLVICGCVVMALTMFFRVKRVEIEGNLLYKDREIQAAANISGGDNMFFLNKYAMAARIARELPYVETAYISREFPDTLHIAVTECRNPMAIDQDGGVWLISPGGKIVDRVDGTGVHYPLISGCELLSPSIGTQIAFAESEAEKQSSLISLLTALRDARMIGKVGGLHLESASVMVMDYDERFTVRLPYGADYPYKLLMLSASMADQKIQEGMRGTFDLTWEDETHFRPGP